MHDPHEVTVIGHDYVGLCTYTWPVTVTLADKPSATLVIVLATFALILSALYFSYSNQSLLGTDRIDSTQKPHEVGEVSP